MQNTRVDGTEKLVAELTIKDGKIVYDLNGMEALPWNAPLDPNAEYASRWTTFAPRPPDTHNVKPTEQPH
jgi:dihydroorotase